MSKDKRFKIKRIYDTPSPDDGYRVLVDRIWPRGMSKEKAKLDEWCKEISPSTTLRKWFDHRLERFDEFKKKYLLELKDKKNEIDRIKDIGNKNNVTILYAAKDENINQAVVLFELLNKSY